MRDPKFLRLLKPTEVIYQFATQVANCFNKGQVLKQKTLGKIEITWLPPSPFWIKINIDSASKVESHMADYGGLFKNMNGNQLHGFIKPLGFCLTFQAKCQVVFCALQVALNLSPLSISSHFPLGARKRRSDL